MPSTVWKGYLSFGLVSFPIRLYSAARPKSIRFHMLHKTDLSRIKEVFYCAEEDKPIDRSDIVKGYEIAKGDYVVVDEEDLKKIAPATAQTMEIQEFVREGEVDPIFLESSYYVGPEDASSKPYALLFAALKETKYYAVAKVAMHGREHIVIIRPTRHGLVLHTMYFLDEINEEHVPKAPAAKFSTKEMDLAKQLVQSLASPFKPEQFHDEYRQNVEKMLEAKQKGTKITAPKAPKHRAVVNIMEALQQSLKQTKAQANTQAKTPAKKRAKKAA